MTNKNQKKLPIELINHLQQKKEHKKKIESVKQDFKLLDSSLAEEIKKRRKIQGLSETALADLSGVSRSTIQKIESSNMKINLENLISVMNVVGMELIWR